PRVGHVEVAPQIVCGARCDPARATSRTTNASWVGLTRRSPGTLIRSSPADAGVAPASRPAGPRCGISRAAPTPSHARHAEPPPPPVAPATEFCVSPTFADVGVPADLVSLLARSGTTAPFAIQAATIPDAIAGRDVCGKAPTGSGKTLAFGLPLIARVGKAKA